MSNIDERHSIKLKSITIGLITRQAGSNNNSTTLVMYGTTASATSALDNKFITNAFSEPQ